MSGVADAKEPSLGKEPPYSPEHHPDHGQEKRIVKGIDKLAGGAWRVTERVVG